MTTKRDILLANGYEEMIGYCFKTPSADNDMLTFVDKEEVFRVLEKGIQTFFWSSNNDELILDIDDAWEEFIDNYLDAHDLDISWEDAEKLLLNEDKKSLDKTEQKGNFLDKEEKK